VAESLGPRVWQAMRERAVVGAPLKAGSQLCKDGGDTSRCERGEGRCEYGGLMGRQGQGPVASGESALSKAGPNLG
jgi:hypothetical protein